MTNPHNPATPATVGRTRTDVAVDWVTWHAGELAAVGLPLVAALVISWWLLMLSVLAGIGWAGHEWRTRRTRQAVLTGQQRPELTGADQHTTTTTAQEIGQESHEPAGEARAETSRKGATA